MYIRYRNVGTLNEIEVRDVRFFRIADAGEIELEDGSEADSFSICDASVGLAVNSGNQAIQSLASYLLGSKEKVFDGCCLRKDVFSLEENECLSELAVFLSKEAAIKVLDEICAAMEAGKQFFDLTRYDENGNLK